MEWVEVRGKSVEVAVAAGLAELGLKSPDDAEIEVLQEPERGFLGLGGQDALVRIKQAPKQGRGSRRRGRGRGGKGGKGSSEHSGGDDRRSRSGGQRRQSGGSAGGNRDRDRSKDEAVERPAGERKEARSGDRAGSGSRGEQSGDQKQRGREASGRRTGGRTERTKTGGADVAEEIDIEQQREIVHSFLEGLVEAFGVDGEVETSVDEDVIMAAVTGEQTEALVGAKGAVLQSVLELARTVVQRKSQAGARIRLDIAGYNERRREALRIYARRLADKVIEEGGEIMLEPMNAAERKVVHDAIVEIDGVRTFSEGQDPNRSVVIAPE